MKRQPTDEERIILGRLQRALERLTTAIDGRLAGEPWRDRELVYLTDADAKMLMDWGTAAQAWQQAPGAAPEALAALKVLKQHESNIGRQFTSRFLTEEP